MSLSVQVRDLSVTYEALADGGRFRRRRVHVTAFQDVSFELKRGDALGLVGHNGSGKSSLLQVVAGLLPHTSGTVLVDAQPQLLGVSAALNVQLSGRENIRLCCLALQFKPAEIEGIAVGIADFTELGEFLDLPVASYSTGMRQRLSFAISIVARPEILLIDEALAVGDQRFKRKCLEALREIRKNAGTVLLATHSMEEVRSSCNKAIWLHNGTVAMFGEPEEVVTAYAKDRSRINRNVDGAG